MISKNKIVELLVKIGCEISYKGFNYLTDVVEAAYDDEPVLYNLSTSVYPGLAKKYNIQPRSIERSIRTMIQNVWDSDPEPLQEISAKRLKSFPSTKQLVAIIVCYLKYMDDD